MSVPVFGINAFDPSLVPELLFQGSRRAEEAGMAERAEALSGYAHDFAAIRNLPTAPGFDLLSAEGR